MGSLDKRLLVIDTDPGVDDAQGILMALASTEVEVIAITVTHGNVSVEQTTLNALRVLKVAERLDIPVYKGASSSLAGTNICASFCHGSDGLGESPDPDAPGLDKAQTEHAVVALLRLANAYPGQITLACLGPLTNVSLALKMDPSFGEKLKECFIMGGNYQATGNTPLNACAEFNFLADPDAACSVLSHLRCPVTMVSWELCLKYSFSWDWYEKLVRRPTAKAEFLKKIGGKSMKIYFKRGTKDELAGYETADSMLMAVVLNHSVATDVRHVFCAVELYGKYTRGQMVVDWDGCLGQKPNVNLVLSLNHHMYGNMLLDAVE